MDQLRDSVLECLESYSKDDDRLIQELDKIAQKSGDAVYTTILHILTHLDMSLVDAKDYWTSIINHRAELISKLGRKVNLRTCVCDYFCSIDVTLKNPKVIEIHLFENKDRASKFDSLTGLYNRSYFDDCLSREMARAKRHNMDLSILFFDLDNFKNINDTYGHLAGDIILKNVAAIILEEIRAEDIAARFGGEEMVLILPQTGKIRGLILGERIREKVENLRTEFQNKMITLTLSGGLASFPLDAGESPHLLKYADTALYAAKSSGKNNISVYSELRRRHFRINFNSEIHVADVSTSQKMSNIRVASKNISKTGILFESNHAFKIGGQLELKIPINGAGEELKITGTVVRIEVRDSDHYEIGVSFTEINRGAKNEIMRYMVKHFEKIYL